MTNNSISSDTSLLPHHFFDVPAADQLFPNQGSGVDPGSPELLLNTGVPSVTGSAWDTGAGSLLTQASPQPLLGSSNNSTAELLLQEIT